MEKENPDKKQYEISFLLKEEGGAGTISKFIKDLGGALELEGPVAKITLAYPIEKEKQGYFGYFHFSLAPGEVKNLEHEMETNPEILRHLIITPPFKKVAPRPRMDTGVRTISKAPVAPTSRQPEPARASETLTNEDLEKRIEEILK
ncbi:MAG: 30S ribosomal protein S6 [Candidatus Liptonbacteria bacterium]|nr:30S ribosomal protein S6 [Candidatus Liptonbacteria bacterium]